MSVSGVKGGATGLACRVMGVISRYSFASFKVIQTFKRLEKHFSRKVFFPDGKSKDRNINKVYVKSAKHICTVFSDTGDARKKILSLNVTDSDNCSETL